MKSARLKHSLKTLLLATTLATVAAGTTSYAQPRAEKYTADSLFMEATSYFLTEKKEDALQAYLLLLEKDPDNATAAYQIAQLLMDKKQFSQARIYAEKACSLQPDNPFFQLLSAQLYRTAHLYNNAAEIYRYLQELQPDNLDYAYEEANMYVMEGKLLKSVEVYNRLEKKYGPTDAWTMQKYKVYMSMGAEKAAKAEIERISKAMPGEVKYLQMLAQMCIKNKDYKQAYAYLKKVQEINPDDPYNHISLADYYRNVGDFKSAFKELEQSVSNPALDFQTKVNVLQSYYGEKGDLKPEGDLLAQALKLFTALSTAHPNEPQGFFAHGKFLILLERYEAAIPVLEHALQLDSSAYSVWHMLLHAAHMSLDTVRLDKYAGQAIARFPEQPAPYMYKALCCILKNRQAQAVEPAQKAMRFNFARDPVIQKVCLQILGDAYFEIGRRDESLQMYEQLFEMDSKDPYVRNNYAYYLALAGTELIKAEALASQLCKEQPKNATFLDTYAWVLYRLGRYDKALTFIKAALDNGAKEDATVWEHYGDILYKSGSTEKAKEQWGRALRLAQPAKAEILKQKINNPEKCLE